MKKTKNLYSAGFTLIEVLVVIGIIAVLAAIVIIAINPARQFAQARDTQRISNINTILNAVGQNLADNKGIFTCVGPDGQPIDIPVEGSNEESIKIGIGKVNLSCLAPTYIPSKIPVDPLGGDDNDTKYTIVYKANGESNKGPYMVCAPSMEISLEKCVTR